MRQVKAEVVAKYMIESNMSNPWNPVYRCVCLQVSISLTKRRRQQGLPPVQDVNISNPEERPVVFSCPWNSQKLDHHLWYQTGKLTEVVPVFRKKHAVAELCARLDQE